MWEAGEQQGGPFVLRGPSPVVRAMLSSRGRSGEAPSPSPAPQPPPSAAAFPAWTPDPEVKWKLLEFGGLGNKSNPKKRGTKRKQHPQFLSPPLPPPPPGSNGTCGRSFIPHVITVDIGEDIAAKILSFSQESPRIVVVFSAHGMVSKAVLGKISKTSNDTVTHEGHFEIINLSGCYLLSSDPDSHIQTGKLSIILSSPEHDVFGGGIQGAVVAASPVVVMVGSFVSEAQAGIGNAEFINEAAGQTSNDTSNLHSLASTIADMTPAPSEEQAERMDIEITNGSAGQTCNVIGNIPSLPTTTSDLNPAPSETQSGSGFSIATAGQSGNTIQNLHSSSGTISDIARARNPTHGVEASGNPPDGNIFDETS